MQVERIEFNSILYAMIFSNTSSNEGINFITEPDALLQLGVMSHPAGHEIIPHVHKPFRRVTDGTQEVMYIKEGKMLVEFYDYEQRYLSNYELNGGDWLILFEGGHGFKIIEDTTFIEVKNGPYVADEDKIRFYNSGDVV